MAEKTKLLDKPGVYLFHAPTKISVRLNRELMIAFVAGYPKIAGVVFFEPFASARELKVMLNIVYQKTLRDLGIPTRQMAIKIFGSSSGSRQAIDTALTFLKDKELKVTAMDIRKNVRRSILLDCNTGKVGVSYAESHVEPPFLATGTARERSLTEPVETQILVLAASRTNRRLIKQAIEEYPGCTAFVPEKPEEMIEQGRPATFPWSRILIFEDMKDASLTSWLRDVKTALPAVKLFWVGSDAPVVGKHALTLLPPLEPFRLGEFKNFLRVLIPGSTAVETGNLLSFIDLKKR